MPSKPTSGDSQSWRVQFRLNPTQSELDALLLDKLLDLNKQGQSDRAICVTALQYYYLENAGIPEMDSVRNLKEVAAELSALRRLMLDKTQVLIDILKSRGVDPADLTDSERTQLAHGLDQSTMNKIFAGVEGEQFIIDDDDSEYE